jgi:hypothetical protein
MTAGAAAATLTKLFGSGSFTDSSNVPFGGRAARSATVILAVQPPFTGPLIDSEVGAAGQDALVRVSGYGPSRVLTSALPFLGVGPEEAALAVLFRASSPKPEAEADTAHRLLGLTHLPVGGPGLPSGISTSLCALSDVMRSGP